MYKFVKNNKLLWLIFIPLMLFWFISDLCAFLLAPGLSLIEVALIVVIIPGIVFYFISPCYGEGKIPVGLYIWGVITLVRINSICSSHFTKIEYYEELNYVYNLIIPASEIETRMYVSYVLVLVIIFMITGLKIPHYVKKHKEHKEYKKSGGMLNDTLFVMNIFNEETKEVRRQVKTVNKQHYPLDKFSYNNEYFAVERFINDERKFFICTKKYWDENVMIEKEL